MYSEAKCTHTLAKMARVGETTSNICIGMEWKLKCYSNKNNYGTTKATTTTKKEMNTNTQTNDNIVWIWKRTTREDKKHKDRLPSRFRCLATTEWYTRNSFAPLLLPTIGECWKAYTAEKTNWNALSRVLFSVLSFSFCVNLLRVVCVFFFSSACFFSLTHWLRSVLAVWLLQNG